MPTLIIENVPSALFALIQEAANTQHQTPADTVLEVLKSAFRAGKPMLANSPLPQTPFLTEEIFAPCTIPWPEGKATRALRVPAPLPSRA